MIKYIIYIYFFGVSLVKNESLMSHQLKSPVLWRSFDSRYYQFLVSIAYNAALAICMSSCIVR